MSLEDDTKGLITALFAGCLAMLAAGWLFYRDDAGDRGEGTISSASAGEVLTEQFMEKQRGRKADLEQELKLLAREERARAKEFEEQLAARQNAQQLQAEERARAKELEEQLAARQNAQQLPAKERARAKELEEQLAAHQNDQQLLAEERQRRKELEERLAANRPPPPVQQPTTSPAAAIDSPNATPVYRPPDEMTKPQPTVRRTGPRPLPKVTQPMPRLSLQASDLTYNPAGYWQVTATLISNTSRALDARVQCSFVNAGRPVGDAEFGPTSVAPGEQISTDLIGPPTTAHVDTTTCHLVGQ